MRLARVCLFGIAVLAGAVAVGCGGDDESNTGTTKPDDAGADAKDAAADADADAGSADAQQDAPVEAAPEAGDAAACPATCTNNAECQTSCPAVDGGMSCCDTKAGVCYATAALVCPTPPPDGGPLPY